MIHFIFLVNKVGKLRLNRWYSNQFPTKDRPKIISDVTDLVTERSSSFSNIIEYEGNVKIVYRKYASLFFIFGISSDDNELLALETIHRFVELLDGHFGNVCELDIVFNYEVANYILNEFVIAGEVIESSRNFSIKAELKPTSSAFPFE